MACVIISLDYEKKWGIHHLPHLSVGYDNGLAIESSIVVPNILAIFDRYELPATWATVGAIALSSSKEYFEVCNMPPNYINKNFSINKEKLKAGVSESKYFSAASVEMILSAKNQELATHGFSHIFSDEKYVSENDFLNDLKLSVDLFENKFSHKVRSFVYPRNKVLYQEKLSSFGITNYRAEYENITNSNSLLKKGWDRINRFGNSFIEKSSQIEKKNYSLGTHFIRFDLPEYLWRIHVEKLFSSLSNLKDNQYLHLWWHPHNMVENHIERLSRLEDIARKLRKECDQSSIEILNMNGYYENIICN